VEAIIVAFIGATGVVLAAVLSFLSSFRKENQSDHAYVVDSLSRIENKLDGHITDHVTGKV
jgi:hypothetical protein